MGSHDWYSKDLKKLIKKMSTARARESTMIGIVKARKSHVCDTCEERIEIGDKYFVDYSIRKPYFRQCKNCCIKAGMPKSYFNDDIKGAKNPSINVVVSGKEGLGMTYHAIKDAEIKNGEDDTKVRQE